MLTLSDINYITKSKDGDIYSDIFKDVYGSRPRGQLFESVEAFDSDFRYLTKRLDEQLTEDNVRQALNLESLQRRIAETQQMVQGSSIERAIMIIADAENISAEDIKFYGWSVLEHEFNIKYGSIKEMLEIA